MYDSVLIPTDGSEQASVAIDKAIELAIQNEATLHALYAIEPIPLGRYAGFGASTAEWDDVVERQREEGEKATEQVVEAATEHGLEVTTAVTHGAPSDEILEYVDEHDIEVIVMGTHGRSGIDRFVIGSVTEKIVRKSPVPVLTVRLSSD